MSRPSIETLVTRSIRALMTVAFLAAGPAVATPLNPFTDHTGEDHSSEDYSDAYLEGIILSSANLTKIKFERADLTNAIAISADLTDAKLKEATLTGADLSSADLTKASLKDAILSGAIMASAVLTKTDLKDADLTGADFTNAILTDVKAKGANFANAVFDSASFASGDIKDAVFTNASLIGADLSGLKNASKADFTGALYNGTTLLPVGVDTGGMVFVPEPSAGLLLMLGLGGLSVYSKRSGRSEGSTSTRPAAPRRE